MQAIKTKRSVGSCCSSELHDFQGGNAEPLFPFTEYSLRNPHDTINTIYTENFATSAPAPFPLPSFGADHLRMTAHDKNGGGKRYRSGSAEKEEKMLK